MSNRANRWLAGIAVALCAALFALTGEPGCAFAQNSSCRSTCLAQYNQCRISTKGAASCDVQYQSCLQTCIFSRY